MERIKISPYAKKCALEADVDYSKLIGTGPNGRIVKRDIDAEIERLKNQLPAGRNCGVMTMEVDLKPLMKLLVKLPKGAEAPKVGNLLRRACMAAAAERELTLTVTDLTEYAVELFLPELQADTMAAVGLCDLEEDEVRLVLCYDRDAMGDAAAAEYLTLAAAKASQPLLLLI